MSDRVAFTINDQKLRLALKNFVARIGPKPLLRAAGAVMMGSIMETFRDEGSPAGSWPPLAAWTKTGALGRIRSRGIFTFLNSDDEGTSGRVRVGTKTTHGRGAGQMRSGKKILIESGRLRNSIAQEIEGTTLRIGSNVVYARIHQLGGNAGRNHASRIPARPYLVFRPEDPDRIAAGMEAVIADAIKVEGLQ